MQDYPHLTKVKRLKYLRMDLERLEKLQRRFPKNATRRRWIEEKKQLIDDVENDRAVDCYSHDFERVELPQGITVNGQQHYDMEM